MNAERGTEGQNEFYCLHSISPNAEQKHQEPAPSNKRDGLHLIYYVLVRKELTCHCFSFVQGV